VRYVAAVEESGVGGDWYDAVPLPGGHVLLVIGDVAGRGLPAATSMVQLRSAVRAYAVEGDGPAQILTRLARYCLALGIAEFVTVLVAIVDPLTGRVTYSSAGHPPLLLLPATGEAELRWTPACPPIGAPIAEQREETLTLGSGDALILYTDGLVEERGRTLDSTLEDLRTTAADGGTEELDALCGRLLATRRTDDDTALLICRRVAVDADVPALEARFPAEAIAVSAMRRAVGQVAAAAGFDDDGVGRVKLAVSEAATNAVLHAYRDVPAPGEVAVRASVVDGELRVVIADEGAGIRPREDSPGLGLGLGMISALTTRVDFVNPGIGTEVHMTFALA
jgi:anti-sigma regulatory factor (Ser/Thr protein kinase)